MTHLTNSYRTTLVALAATLLLGLSQAAAATMDTYRFEGSYGSGANRVALIADFGSGSQADSYAFEVRFDSPSINGLELMSAISTGTGGLFNYTTDDSYSYGLLINSLAYGARSVVSNSQSDPTLNYWVSNDAGQSWTQPWVALQYVDLQTNDTLGWTSELITWYCNYDTGDWYSLPDFADWHRPTVPLATTATPEPSTLALALTGFIALAWQWRRRRGH